MTINNLHRIVGGVLAVVLLALMLLIGTDSVVPLSVSIGGLLLVMAILEIVMRHRDHKEEEAREHAPQ